MKIKQIMVFFISFRMSSIKEKDSLDIPSPASSTISTSSSSESEYVSDVQGTPQEMHIYRHQIQQEDHDEGEEERDELSVAPEAIADPNDVIYLERDMPGSASSLELEEKRSRLDYSLSQRIFCSPSCKISAVLQWQSGELWKQFDNIGTEMIVTRRGRYAMLCFVLLKIFFPSLQYLTQ